MLTAHAFDVLLRALRLPPMDRHDHLGSAGLAGPGRILNTHGVVTTHWEKRDITSDPEHRREEVGVTGVIVGGAGDRKDVAEPTLLRRVVLLVQIVQS